MCAKGARGITLTSVLKTDGFNARRVPAFWFQSGVTIDSTSLLTTTNEPHESEGPLNDMTNQHDRWDAIVREHDRRQQGRKRNHIAECGSGPMLSGVDQLKLRAVPSEAPGDVSVREGETDSVKRWAVSFNHVVETLNAVSQGTDKRQGQVRAMEPAAAAWWPAESRQDAQHKQWQKPQESWKGTDSWIGNVKARVRVEKKSSGNCKRLTCHVCGRVAHPVA